MEKPVRVKITNHTRLASTGEEATVELWPGDVLEVTPAEAVDLIGNGKADKIDERDYGKNAVRNVPRVFAHEQEKAKAAAEAGTK